MEPVSATPSARRNSRARGVAAALFVVLTAASVACTYAIPPAPYYGPYGSAQGVTNEAVKRSTALEQYVKDWLDGKTSATIPANLIPEGHDPSITTFSLKHANEVNPAKQWETRLASPINRAASYGLFDDPNATYEVNHNVLVPFGSKIIIDGQFPHARYFSIQPTPSFAPQDYRQGSNGEGEVSFLDADINPLPGSTNPYRVGADRTAPNRSYRVTCDVAVGEPSQLDANAWRAPNFRDPGNNNRHCSGLTFRGPWGDPAAKDGDHLGLWGTGELWIRTYAPDKNTNAYGGVPLPKMMYQLPDGRQYYIESDLTAITARLNATRPLNTEAPKDPGGSSEGSGMDKQFSINRSVQGGIVQNYNLISTDPALQRKYVRDLDLGVSGKGENQPGIMGLEPHATGGVHINYLDRIMCLGPNKLYTISGTLPVTPKTRNGETTMTGGQARYWSLTGYSVDYDLANKDYVYGAQITGIMDDEITTRNGNYTLMYGRAADRPANATAANGVTWIDWGPEACQALTLRWISAGPEWSFAKTPNTANLGWEASWASASYDPTKLGTNFRRGFLGAYQPLTDYLTAPQFAAEGNNIFPLDSDLALKQPATATSGSGTTAASAAVDGDSSTEWSSAWWSDPQALTSDLGATRSIHRVRLKWDTSYATDYTIQVSADNANWTTIYTKTGGTGGDEMIVLPAAATGRYVRLNATKHSGNNDALFSFQVWGA